MSCRQIISVATASGNFSPELFFSLYSFDNGYKDTEVFIADLTDSTRWFKVLLPKNGQRLNVFSYTELYVLVRTVLREHGFAHDNVQQSDYVSLWVKNSTKALKVCDEKKPNNLKKFLKKLLIYRLISPMLNYRRKFRNARNLRKRIKLDTNKNLIQINISTIMK